MLATKIKKVFNHHIAVAILLVSLIFSLLSIVNPPTAGAVTITCPDGTKVTIGSIDAAAQNDPCKDHQAKRSSGIKIECPDGTEVSVGSVDAAAQSNPCANHGGSNSSSNTTTRIEGDCNDEDLTKDCGIVGYLLLFINVLSGLVGIVIVIMIIWGGIEYSMSGNDPQKVGAAKSKIVNALLALFVFIFMFAFLQWVVPGGVF